MFIHIRLTQTPAYAATTNGASIVRKNLRNLTRHAGYGNKHLYRRDSNIIDSANFFSSLILVHLSISFDIRITFLSHGYIAKLQFKNWQAFLEN